MGTDGHLITHRKRNSVGNCSRIARMKTAGNVGAGQIRHQGLIVAHLPGAKAFTDIGIQINSLGHGNFDRMESVMAACAR